MIISPVAWGHSNKMLKYSIEHTEYMRHLLLLSVTVTHILSGSDAGMGHEFSGRVEVMVRKLNGETAILPVLGFFFFFFFSFIYLFIVLILQYCIGFAIYQLS